MKKLIFLCLFSPMTWASVTCGDFTRLFEQRDFPKIESAFKRAAQELGYPDSSIYLNYYYAKPVREQILELRRVYRGCYSLRRKDDRLVEMLR